MFLIFKIHILSYSNSKGDLKNDYFNLCFLYQIAIKARYNGLAIWNILFW